MEGRRPTDWELSTAPLEGRGMGKGNEADSTSLSDPMESVLLLHRGPEVRSKQHPRQLALYTEGLWAGSQAVVG